MTRAYGRIVATTDVHSTLDRADSFLPYLHELMSASLIADCGDFFEGTGYYRLGKGTIGYEMFRASTIRLSAHFDATLPMYRLKRTRVDLTGLELDEHIYAPTFELYLGLGWGGRSDPARVSPCFAMR